MSLYSPLHPVSQITQHLAETAAAVLSAVEPPARIMPKVGIILGSGLGSFAEGLQDAIRLNYADLPHFPEAHGHVAGHQHQLVLAPWNNTHIACLQGRFHAYEGYAFQQVVYPVRLLKTLGVETLIVTNAAGGIHPSFQPGDLMLMTDHLNLTGQNPLVGANDPDLGPRFLDMTEAYCPSLRQIALNVAKQKAITLKQGVYAGLLGPTYETPAEVRMLRTLGADAVGMSTVAEVIAARHAGMRILGLSCITNAAAAEGNAELNHEEVLLVGQQAGERFQALLVAVLDALLS